jgi:hypothetical protein
MSVTERPRYNANSPARANVAELADALDLGSSGRKAMGVRPSPFAPELTQSRNRDASLFVSLRSECAAALSRAPSPGGALYFFRRLDDI